MVGGRHGRRVPWKGGCHRREVGDMVEGMVGGLVGRYGMGLR